MGIFRVLWAKVQLTWWKIRMFLNGTWYLWQASEGVREGWKVKQAQSTLLGRFKGYFDPDSFKWIMIGSAIPLFAVSTAIGFDLGRGQIDKAIGMAILPLAAWSLAALLHNFGDGFRNTFYGLTQFLSYFLWWYLYRETETIRVLAILGSMILGSIATGIIFDQRVENKYYVPGLDICISRNRGLYKWNNKHVL